MSNRRAIALLVMPSPSAASTSSSRGVSNACPSASRIAEKPGSLAAGTRTIRPAATARMAASIWFAFEIGRASCRERVLILVVGVSVDNESRAGHRVPGARHAVEDARLAVQDRLDQHVAGH